MNKKIRNIAVLMVSAFALGQGGEAWAADANPPERMTYQGYLVDGNGDPLGSVVDPSDSTQRVSAPANYDIVFRIYNVKQSGTAIWAEQQTVTVDMGYFSVLLGEGSQYGSELHGNLSAAFDGADASDRFIGITVDIGGVATEIAPRLRLVSSPYAYTARQARRLTDGSGNSNFAKVGTSLELGAGSTPTLTLPEAGGASLVGKLTADLPGWGDGLQIDNGTLSTTFGAQHGGMFHVKTGLPNFYFNKTILVNGNIQSYQQDTVLGPSNNTDTYLRVKSAEDKIVAQADEFWVKGDSNWLYTKFTASAAELRTDAASIYLNKPLTVDGALSASSLSMGGNISIVTSNTQESVLELRGTDQGTGRLYLGQSLEYGGGIIYNGDGDPAFSGSTEADHISFYRTTSGTHHEVFRYPYNSNDVTFNGDVKIGTDAVFPKLIIDSTSSGDGWTSQGAQISIGEQAGSGGAATMHMTYNGGGYGWVGAGSISNGEPSGANIRFHYSDGGTTVINGEGGNVGIGTDSPSTYLHIGLARDAEANSSGLGSFMIGSRSGTHMRMDDNELMAMNNNGTTTLYLNANGGTVKAGSSTVTSDQRLKHNIHPIKYGLSELRELKPVSYDWKLDLFNLPGTQLGFIAQDVQKVLPELVMVEEDAQESRFKDELSLNVNGILPVVVASVQELDKENRQLKSELETLKSEMAVLKSRLANSTTQEDRIAKLEELVSKIGQGE